MRWLDGITYSMNMSLSELLKLAQTHVLFSPSAEDSQVFKVGLKMDMSLSKLQELVKGQKNNLYV